MEVQELSYQGLTQAVFCVPKAQDTKDAAKQRLSDMYLKFLWAQKQLRNMKKRLLKYCAQHAPNFKWKVNYACSQNDGTKTFAQS